MLNKNKIFSIVKLISAFINQFSSLFLIYILPAKEYGKLVLLMSVSSLMFILTSGWTNGVLINLGTKRYVQKKNYNDIVIYRSCIIISSMFFVSLFFFIFKDSISLYIKDIHNLKYVYLYFIGLVAFDFSYQLLYPGNKNFLQSSLEFCIVFIILLLVYFFAKDGNMYITIYTIFSIIFLLLVLSIFIASYYKYSFQFNVNDFKNVLHYSLWQILSVICIYIINVGMNYVFVYNEVDLKSIGQFNFSFKLFMGFSSFFSLFGILIPKWVNTNEITNRYLFLKKKIITIVVALFIIYIIVYLFLEPLIYFVGKEDYLSSIEYFKLLIPSFLLMTYSNLLNTIIANTPFYKNAQYAIAIQVIVLLILSYPLVHIWKIEGMIIAITTSYIVNAIYFHSIYKSKIKDYLISISNL